jgi:hypothetical protein
MDEGRTLVAGPFSEGRRRPETVEGGPGEAYSYPPAEDKNKRAVPLGDSPCGG